jgi:hypothetical protein
MRITKNEENLMRTHSESNSAYQDCAPRFSKSYRGLASTLLVLGLAGGNPMPAWAGQDCEQAQATVSTLDRGLRMAERTRQSLEAEYTRTGAQVMVLARAGQDLSKYGLRYSHLGFVMRTPEGFWRVVHKLNTCGTAESSLYRQGLGEFFMDNPRFYEAGWVSLTSQAQSRVYAMLNDPVRAGSFHHRPYSMVSYAWGQRYQQSNQWALETLAAAMEPGVVNRGQAQAWLQFKGYTPSPLTITPLTRLGGRIGMANVAFDDHPNDKRFNDRIETVTVDSVFAWLKRASLGGEITTVRL